MDRGWMRRNLRVVAPVGVVAAGLTIFALVWFQPQKLIIEKTVNEAAPTSASSSSNRPATGAVATGPFQSLEHRTTGTASIIRLANGSHVLRFENLDTSNGPDLRVYLSTVPASDDWHAYGRTGTYLELGRLRGNRGNQNYAIPSDADLSRYRSAVIWCVRFRVGFGVAPLEVN